MNQTDRMPPLSDADMTAEQRQAVAAYATTRKTAVFEGPFVPLLRSPELLDHVQRVGEYLRYRNALPRRLSELAILIAARHWSQQFEWNIHAADAATAGLADRDRDDALQLERVQAEGRAEGTRKTLALVGDARQRPGGSVYNTFGARGAAVWGESRLRKVRTSGTRC